MDAIHSSSVYSLQEMTEMMQQAVEKRNGQALLPDELKHLEALRQRLSSLTDRVSPSRETDTTRHDNGEVMLREGRYLAANAQFQAELRVDTGQTGIVSLDIYLRTISSRTYLASFRSNPGEEIKPGQRLFGVIGEDEEGNQATGKVELLPLSETQVTIKITMNRGLGNLPVNVPTLLSANWQSPYFRTIGLEIDREAEVPALPDFPFEGRNVTLESCFGEAGLEIIPFGRRDIIPRPIRGWDEAQLHGLMTRFTSESLNQKSWLLHLLVLSRATEPRLLGIMFDSGELDANGLPRQGAAVFTDPIRDHPAGFKRKMLQTSIHELGHALNLAHRFERSVSRADSTSCMNYDWRYMGGRREEQFWRDFRFSFDPDEVRFLRHGMRSALIPGGSEFHSINYWSDGSGGYSPYLPEEEISGLELSLHPPATGALFSFAQPVLLTIELMNTSGRALDIPLQFLDPKSGFLEIIIQRVGVPGRNSAAGRFTFSPLIHRCWDLQEIEAEIVPNGKSLRNNLNITFGSAGFTFAEPGNYEVTAVLSFIDKTRQIDQIVRSNPLRIRVAHPQSLEEERDAVQIFRKDVGFYLALGGSDVLADAGKTLDQISKRRQKGSKEINDPLVANIVRAQAINSSRDFITYQEGKFHLRGAETQKAVELLSQLDASAQQFFDPATQERNRGLMDRLQNS